MATTQVSIRIDPDLLRRLGEAAEAYSARVGVKVSRNAFMELAMAKGIEAIESEG
jgi:predicted transcriptional regulator